MQHIEWKQTGERVASRPLAGQQRRQTKVTQFDCAALSHQHIGTPTYTREEESGWWWWRRLTWCRGARCWESVDRRVRAPIQPLTPPPSHLVQCNNMYACVRVDLPMCAISFSAKPFTTLKSYPQINNTIHYTLYDCDWINTSAVHPSMCSINIQNSRVSFKANVTQTKQCLFEQQYFHNDSFVKFNNIGMCTHFMYCRLVCK